jgi:hypothetical protein
VWELSVHVGAAVIVAYIIIVNQMAVPSTDLHCNNVVAGLSYVYLDTGCPCQLGVTAARILRVQSQSKM